MEHLRGQQSSDSTCTSIISCDPLFGTDAHNYRPQTKFGARLSFYTCLWFCSLGGGGVPGQVPPGRHTPWQVHPQAGTPPGRYTPQAGTPPGRYTPWQVHPPGTRYPTPQTRYTARPVHAGRYGQQAGGMHPTGMHACYDLMPGKQVVHSICIQPVVFFIELSFNYTKLAVLTLRLT